MSEEFRIIFLDGVSGTSRDIEMKAFGAFLSLKSASLL